MTTINIADRQQGFDAWVVERRQETEQGESRWAPYAVYLHDIAETFIGSTYFRARKAKVGFEE